MKGMSGSRGVTGMPEKPVMFGTNGMLGMRGMPGIH